MAQNAKALEGTRALDAAARSNGNLFITFALVLIVSGLLIGALTIWLRRSDTALQELVQQDANARIEDAGARADRAKAEGEQAKKDAALANKGAADATARAEEANRRAQELENANLSLSEKIEALKRENLVLGVNVAKANTTASVAQKEAAEARLALEQYKAPRISGFDAAKQTKVSVAAKRFAGLKFDVGIASGDSECAFLLDAIESVLRNAGLVQVDWQDLHPAALSFERAGRPKVGNITAIGLLLEVDSQRHPEFWDAAQGIVSVLNEVGLASKAYPDLKTNGANPDVIHVLIGKKP